MHWLAQVLAGGDGGEINLGLLSQYGILGLVTSGLIWFAKGAHQREKDRADRLEAKNEQLSALIIDRVIPALMSASNATEQTAELLRAIQRDREQTRLIKQTGTRKGRDADPE